MTDCYAVVGDPIAHSKSPLIHRLFAEQTGEDMVYEAIRIDSEESSFAYAVQSLMAKGYQGLNVTVPYKLDAFEFADTLTERAKVAHAVNTLVFQEQGVIGDNTDGLGLVNDIENHAGVSLSDRRILILGAGGAVQGVMQPILDRLPAEVHLANRTAKRAEVLAARFDTSVPVSASGWEDIPNTSYDIVINGTAASLEGKIPPIGDYVLNKDTLVYDMMYGSEPTVFMAWAKKACPTVRVRDGLGMLVEQAAEAFALWRGVRPNTAEVIEAVRSQMLKK